MKGDLPPFLFDMVDFPVAKINLGLHVLSKRADGYHNIETIMYPIPLQDIVEVVPADKLQFTSHGLTIDGPWESNLCVKAYQTLKKDFDIPPVHIHLYKKIPMGAGLGGGSSDAAYTLKILNSLFELKLSTLELNKYAERLGSDCPFFITTKPALATGTGTTLTPVNVILKNIKLVVASPDIHVSTALAYSKITPTQPNYSLLSLINSSISDWKGVLKNDFEASVFSSFPVIEDIKRELYEKGALYASMSGSGSAVFGLFPKDINITERDFEFRVFLADID